MMHVARVHPTHGSGPGVTCLVPEASPERQCMANKALIDDATRRSSMGVAIITCLRVYMHILHW